MATTVVVFPDGTWAEVHGVFVISVSDKHTDIDTYLKSNDGTGLLVSELIRFWGTHTNMHPTTQKLLDTIRGAGDICEAGREWFKAGCPDSHDGNRK